MTFDAPSLPDRSARELLVAVDLGGTKTAIAVTDRQGNRLGRTTMPTDAGAGITAVMGRVAGAGRRLLGEIGADLSAVAAAAAVSPGVVLEDRVLLAPNNDGWESLALAREIQAAFGASVSVVDNDVKAAARAEARWGHLAGADTGIFFNLGTGVAFALVAHGEVLRGAHGAAGEIGYQLTGRSTDRPFGSGGAPLEEITGGRALAERVSDLLARPVTTAEAVALAGQPGPAGQLVDDALALLARHVANLAVALDPDVVVVGGGMTGSAGVIFPVLQAELQRTVPYPPRLELAHFNADSGLAGAVLLAVEAVAARPAPHLT